jgi:hypothetical protein
MQTSDQKKRYGVLEKRKWKASSVTSIPNKACSYPVCFVIRVIVGSRRHHLILRISLQRVRVLPEERKYFLLWKKLLTDWWFVPVNFLKAELVGTCLKGKPTCFHVPFCKNFNSNCILHYIRYNDIRCPCLHSWCCWTRSQDLPICLHVAWHHQSFPSKIIGKKCKPQCLPVERDYIK